MHFYFFIGSGFVRSCVLKLKTLYVKKRFIEPFITFCQITSSKLTKDYNEPAIEGGVIEF